MAEVTVKKLAEIVGAPLDRLLKQMSEAGLAQSKATDTVSDEEKQMLLAFLKRSHGESDGAPKKITLKRKVTTQLRTSGSQGRTAKTVNVEVRKKRSKRRTLTPWDHFGVGQTCKPFDAPAPRGWSPEIDEKVIYRVSGDVAKRTRIQTGSRSVARIEILAGLEAGDTVIVSDIERFRGAERVLLRD